MPTESYEAWRRNAAELNDAMLQTQTACSVLLRMSPLEMQAEAAQNRATVPQRVHELREWTEQLVGAAQSCARAAARLEWALAHPPGSATVPGSDTRQ